MPLISGGGGGSAFNGGTITRPLTVDMSGDATSERALHVILPEDFDFSVDAFTFEVNNQFGLLRFTPQGQVNTSGNTLSTGGANAQVNSLIASGSVGSGTVGGQQASLSPALGVVTNRTTAPADGDISSSNACLWFDPTDGASALKIKAKTANGTVATATIPLT